MRVSLTRPSRLLAWVPIFLVSLCGCATSPQGSMATEEDPADSVAAPEPARSSSVNSSDPAFYTDDFGDDVISEPITAESVSEGMMLHRRGQFEMNAGMVMPIGEFELGPSLGLKGSIEATKNVFFGVSFDWARQSVDEGVSDLSNPNDLESANADQFYEYINRYNFLLTADYDIPIQDDFLVEDSRLILRLGIGAGVGIIQGKEDDAVRGSLKIQTYYGLLLRPAVSLRWQLWKTGGAFFTAAYDFLYPDKIDVRITGLSRRVDDDLYFGTFLVQFGVMFEF